MWYKSSSLLLLLLLFCCCINVSTSRNLRKSQQQQERLPDHGMMESDSSSDEEPQKNGYDLMDDPYTLDGEAKAKKEGYDLKETLQKLFKDVLDQIQQLDKAVSHSNESKKKQFSKHALMDDPYVLDGENRNDGYDMEKSNSGKIDFKNLNNDGGYGNDDNNIPAKKLGDHDIMDESPSDDNYKAHGRFRRDYYDKDGKVHTDGMVIPSWLVWTVVGLAIFFCVCFMCIGICAGCSSRVRERTIYTHSQRSQKRTTADE